MSELKAGDTKVFDVGGEKLVVEPLPFGNLKKLLRIVMEVSEKGRQGDTAVLSIPTLLENYADDAIPLLFKKGKHGFLTREWIDENLTMPVLREILEAVAAVNGMSNFFGSAVTPRAADAVPPSSATTPTLTENIESTTSSASPTGGGQETLTK